MLLHIYEYDIQPKTFLKIQTIECATDLFSGIFIKRDEKTKVQKIPNN
jgi:hypothetical protein